MLAHRLRQWPDIVPALCEHLVFDGMVGKMWFKFQPGEIVTDLNLIHKDISNAH